MRLSFLVESPILYLAFFKTILAALFRAFGLPLSFLPSKPSFLHDHSTTQHSNFSSFLAISTTDKPVNRSIQAYALTQLNVFALRGFIFRDIHKKQGRSSSNSGYRIQKICGWKIYSRTRTFGAEVHKSNIRVKRWHNKYENSELDWKTQLLTKWFAYQVQSYWNTDLKSRGTNFWDTPYVYEFPTVKLALLLLFIMYDTRFYPKTVWPSGQRLGLPIEASRRVPGYLLFTVVPSSNSCNWPRL